MNKKTVKNIPAIIAAIMCCSIAAYAQPTASYNYVVSNSMLQPGITTQAQIDALAVTGRTQAVDYFDGLGRPLQSVLTQANHRIRCLRQGNKKIFTLCRCKWHGVQRYKNHCLCRPKQFL
jgi:hypothetical protein